MTAKRYEIHNAADPTVTVIYPELAKEIGLYQSIILIQIAYWIRISDNLRDGVYWTYQSYRDMRKKAFPYISLGMLRKMITELAESSYILIGNYNTRPGDRTQWYALEPNGLSRLKSVVVMEVTKSVLGEKTVHTVNMGVHSMNSMFTDGTTLPEITSESSSDIKTTTALDVASAGQDSDEKLIQAELEFLSSSRKNLPDPPEPFDPPAAKPAKPRDPIFDEVAYGSFGLRIGSTIPKELGGRIAKISTWLKKERPEITGKDLSAFYIWYEIESPTMSAPKALDKFQEYFLRWLDLRANGGAKDPRVRTEEVWD